jgi:hypothetical protein
MPSRLIQISSITLMTSDREWQLWNMKQGFTIAQTGLPLRWSALYPRLRNAVSCDLESGCEASFLRVLRFRMPFLVPATASHSSTILPSGATCTHNAAKYPATRVKSSLNNSRSESNLSVATRRWKVLPFRRLSVLNNCHEIHYRFVTSSLTIACWISVKRRDLPSGIKYRIVR